MNEEHFTVEQHIRFDEDLKTIRALLLRNTTTLARHYPPDFYRTLDNLRVELYRFIIKMNDTLKEEVHESVPHNIYYA